MARSSILALDPGVRHTGWAVLTTEEQVGDVGTFTPTGTLSGLERHLWLLTRIQGLIATWHPQVLAYEEFNWRNDGRYVSGRASMERLIGGIQGLALQPPYPVLVPLSPNWWGAQLLGAQQHTKGQMAWAVNCRLGTTFRGDARDNHAADATGLALVASDLLRRQQLVQGNGPAAPYDRRGA